MSKNVQWFFLSERGLDREGNHISYGVNYELEDLLIRVTSGTLVAPANTAAFRQARRVPLLGKPAGYLTGSLAGRFEPFEVSRDTGGMKVLFVMGMGSTSLRLLRAVKNLRRSFDKIVAFVLDSFEPFPMDVVPSIDHLFMIIPDMVDGLQSKLRIPVSFLPLACDVCDLGSMRQERCIDVLAYGRQWPRHATELDHHFLSPGCPHLYLTRFDHPRATTTQHQRKQFWSVLARSRISTAFVPDSSQTRFQGLPVITARWYEGLAAGCVMVGRRPSNPMFEKLFFWDDAAFELPDDPSRSPAVIEGLLGEPERLRRAHVRNHLHMLRTLDARLIFSNLCKIAELPVPEGLSAELEAHGRRVEAVSQTAKQLGIKE